ncbi:tetratricopeptide repeat protein [Undibacterium cyanobacteriorum]|uniref:Tetratricopeptide repeat protein n=1 Tax=Undibacterium cyanobacteriorum TaxID=3073561 RepID=A0ABY9RKG6_9BURK|nr:tetratricopeptide repeat protein [Undibacterium sp. 20NA77.5]WMW81698.1 tetratricopeptide repeat protein [Undibacterium sp. 20NA77.5]
MARLTMQRSTSFLMVILLCLQLSACSTLEKNQALELQKQQQLWADQDFIFVPNSLPNSDDLFRLSPSLERKLASMNRAGSTIQERANFLTSLLYTDQARPFLYEGYHTTTAHETWEKNRGDCLSLSILAYAIGKRLQLPIHIQDVPMPVQFDRHGRVEYVNGHVNAIVLNPNLFLNTNEGHERGYMLIDFDPNQFSMRRGRILSEEDVLALFYNNLGVESMLQGKHDLAYTYFKQAAMAAPLETSTYSNLAQLYLSRNLADKAAATLEFALSLENSNVLQLRNLQALYHKLGRTQDALRLQERIARVQEQDPYYWIGKGLHAAQNKQYTEAISYLERAQKYTSGFEEVHQALAKAYWQTGAFEKSRQQIRLLAAVNSSNPKLRYLKAHFASN